MLDADYAIETRVNAADQECYLDRLLPVGNKRDTRFESLGLSKFPFEGRGNYDTWLTGSGFRELLHIGLIHPLSVAKVLAKIASDSNFESCAAAQRGFAKMRDKFLKDIPPRPIGVWDPPLEGLDVWRRVFGISNNTFKLDEQANFDSIMPNEGTQIP